MSLYEGAAASPTMSWSSLPLEVRQNIITQLFTSLLERRPNYGVTFRRTLAALTKVNQSFGRDDVMRPLRKLGEHVSSIYCLDKNYYTEEEYRVKWQLYGEYHIYKGATYIDPCELQMDLVYEAIAELEGQQKLTTV